MRGRSLLRFRVLVFLLFASVVPLAVHGQLSDGALFIALQFQSNAVAPPSVDCSSAGLLTAFEADVAAQSPTCVGAFSSSSWNSSACLFQIRPPLVDDAMVPCFDALVEGVGQDTDPWTRVEAEFPNAVVHANVFRVAIGSFTHSDNESGRKYVVALVIILLAFAAFTLIHIVSSCFLATGWPIPLSQLLSCAVIYGTVLIGVMLYLSIVTYQPPPYITSSYDFRVDSCYVRLQDVAPWDIDNAIEHAAISLTDAPLQFSGNTSSIAAQWPCKARVFYNPYHINFAPDGTRIPMTVTVTGSTLVVESSLNTTYLPLVIASTTQQLKANRVYLDHASFFSIAVNLFSGIAYVSESVTNPTKHIELNATSVFVSVGEVNNPKSLVVRHTTNPPLFCLSPQLNVTFNASSCTGSAQSSGDGGSANNGGGDSSQASLAGGNESYIGFQGTCTLTARDTFPNRTVSSYQVVHIRCASVYGLPSNVDQVPGKVVGSGFLRPPELSRAILGALNSSASWSSTVGLFTDYVQSIELVTPLLGIQFLNTNNPSILEFFPELLLWLTGFVLQPAYRELQAVPDHYTCTDATNLASLVPPPATLVMYHDTRKLNANDERFAAAVLEQTFDAVSQFPPGGLTSYMLPYEAERVFPSIQRFTFDDGVATEIQRPPVADALIVISAILSALLMCGVLVVLVVNWTRIHDYLTLLEKKKVVDSTRSSAMFPRKKQSAGAPAADSAKGVKPALPKPSSSGEESDAGSVNATAAASSPDASKAATGVQTPSASKKSPLSSVLEVAESINEATRVVIRVINGLAYRACRAFATSIHHMLSTKSSMTEFAIMYLQPIASSAGVTGSGPAQQLQQSQQEALWEIKDFNVIALMYRAYCVIFDRDLDDTLKTEGKMRTKLAEIYTEHYGAQFRSPPFDPRNLRVMWRPKQRLSQITGNPILFRKEASTGDERQFESDVNAVGAMFEANSLSYATASWRAGAGHWSSGFRWMVIRYLRHPFSMTCLQTFLFLIITMLPIAFAVFTLFALEVGMTPYQLYGVVFRTVHTRAAFLPTPQHNVTIQIVLLWMVYIALGSVAFERVLNALVLLGTPTDRSQKGCCSWLHHVLLFPFTALSLLFRCALSLTFVLSCFYTIGYVFIVALWWVLTCFLAPNVMIPFATSSITTVGALYGIYKALRHCKTELSKDIQASISAALTDFFQKIQVVLSAEGITIAKVDADPLKTLASATQLPLEVIEFACAPTDPAAKRRYVSTVLPSSSAEFAALADFLSTPNANVNDCTPVLQPYLALMSDSKTKYKDGGDGGGESVAPPPSKSSCLAQVANALLTGESDGRGISTHHLRASLVARWSSSILKTLAEEAVKTDNGDLRKQYGGLQRMVELTSAFAVNKSLAALFTGLLQLWYPFTDAFTTPSRSQAAGASQGTLPEDKPPSGAAGSQAPTQSSTSTSLGAITEPELWRWWQCALPVLSRFVWLVDRNEAVATTANLAAMVCAFQLPKDDISIAALCDAATKREQELQRQLAVQQAQEAEHRKAQVVVDTRTKSRFVAVKNSAATPAGGGRGTVDHSDMETALLPNSDYHEMGSIRESDGKFLTSPTNTAVAALPGGPTGDDAFGSTVAMLRDAVAGRPWSYQDPTAVSGFRAGPSDKAPKKTPLLFQWLSSMLHGREWPTLNVRKYLPMLNTLQWNQLTTYSLAGIAPAAFAKLENWNSTSSRAVRNREAWCLAALAQREVAEPTTGVADGLCGLELAGEAYYYPVVKAYLDAATATGADVTQSTLLTSPRIACLQELLRVSCPVAAALLDAPTPANASKAFVDHIKAYSLISYGVALSTCVTPRNAGDGAVAPDAVLALCQEQRTPLHLLALIIYPLHQPTTGSTTEADSDAVVRAVATQIVDKVRTATGANVYGGVDKDGRFTLTTPSNDDSADATTTEARVLEAVCCACVMQSYTPRRVLETLWRVVAWDGTRSSSHSPARQQSSAALWSPTRQYFHCLPFCGAMHIPLSNSDAGALQQVTTQAVLRAAATRSDGLSAAAALYIFNARNKKEQPMPLRDVLRDLAATQLAVKNSDGTAVTQTSLATMPTSAVDTFFDNPRSLLDGSSSAFRDVFGALGEETVSKRLYRTAIVVDTVGALFKTDGGGKPRRTLSVGGVLSIFDYVFQSATPTGATESQSLTKSRALLSTLVGHATGSAVPGEDLRTTFALMNGFVTVPNVTLLDDDAQRAFAYLGQVDKDNYGVLTECVVPLLLPPKVKDTFKDELRVVAIAISHAVHFHHFKRRGPVLLEVFRERIKQCLMVAPTVNSVVSVAQCPVDEWATQVLDFVGTGDIQHLRNACAAVGVGQDIDWTPVQRYKKTKDAFSASIEQFQAQKGIEQQIIEKLKQHPFFAALASSMEEQLQSSQSTHDLVEKLKDKLHSDLLVQLHISDSDIAHILIYSCTVLACLAAFVLLGILAFSNGSTFSALIGVAFPAAGGTFSQIDPEMVLANLRDKAKTELNKVTQHVEDATTKLASATGI